MSSRVKLLSHVAVAAIAGALLALPPLQASALPSGGHPGQVSDPPLGDTGSTTTTSTTTTAPVPPTGAPPTTPPSSAPPPSTRPPSTRPPGTTTTGPPTTVPGTTTTVSSPPRPGTKPHADHVGGGDAGNFDQELLDAPPAERLPAPSVTAPQAIGGRGGNVTITEVETARRDFEEGQVRLYDATTLVAGLKEESARIDRRIKELGTSQRRAVKRYARAKEDLADSAADAYTQAVSGQGNSTTALSASDVNEAVVILNYGGALLEAGERDAEELLEARRRMGDELLTLGDEKVSVALQLEQARRDLLHAHQQVDAAEVAVQVFDSGGGIFVNGFVFPVADPHLFVDSYGAPRMFGTGYAHFHEGTDIMAPAGTPLFACETGTIKRVRQNVLGGITLTIRGDSGTEYYYAHLSAYAEGITEGMPVTGGTIVGFVGNTGNAKTTPPHLHYEIHPGGGESVNPYPLLHVVDARNRGDAIEIPVVP